MSGTQRESIAPSNGSGKMFDQIATRYDLLNRVISMGFDRGWRRRLVRGLNCDGRCRVLDVATGTADVAVDVATYHTLGSVVGLDPSTGMLEVGRKKVEALGLDQRIDLVEGDAQEMPFEDDSFDASCISFGIRNVPDRDRGLREMARVTRPGGRVVVLELSEPRTGFLAPFARFHVHHVVPRIGGLLSGSKEYRYLQQSIESFPPPEDFAGMMRDAGLRDVSVSRMSFGVAFLYSGTVSR
jgi:demethylmenaquinone methyltransferase/2-methoxy-6-polyprenyl-1,4-benzoquinol methylase